MRLVVLLLGFLLFGRSALAGDVAEGVSAYGDGRYDEAYEALLPAAQAGDAQAQYYIGRMSERGEGVSRDYDEAAKWYGKAAEKGNADAQNSLGGMYEYGMGVEKDAQKAAALYWQANHAGNEEAGANLKSLKDRGLTTPGQTVVYQAGEFAPAPDDVDQPEPSWDKDVFAPPPAEPAGNPPAVSPVVYGADEFDVSDAPADDDAPMPSLDGPAGEVPRRPKPISEPTVYDPKGFIPNTPHNKAMVRERELAEIDCIRPDQPDLVADGHLMNKYFSLSYACGDTKDFARKVKPIQHYVSRVWDVFSAVPGKYQAAGFKELPAFEGLTPVGAVVDDKTPGEAGEPRFNVYVLVYDYSFGRILEMLGATELAGYLQLNSFQASKYGTIYVPYLMDIDYLQRSIAHEIFHLVQGQYYTMLGKTDVAVPLTGRSGYSLLARGWWMEATAEYAAHTIAFGSRDQPDAGMGGLTMTNYLAVPITYKSSAFSGLFGVVPKDPFENHEYATAWFLHYLVSERGIRFADMFTWIADQNNPSLESLLDQYLKDKAGVDLVEACREFAPWWLFDPERPGSKAGVPHLCAEQTVAVRPDAAVQTVNLNVADTYAAAVGLVQPANDLFRAGGASLSASPWRPVITLTCESIPDGAQVAAYLWGMQKDATWKAELAGVLAGDRKELDVRPGPGQDIYCILTSANGSCGVRILIQLGKTELAAADAPKDGVMDGDVLSLGFRINDKTKPEKYKIILSPRDEKLLYRDIDIPLSHPTAKVISEKMDGETFTVDCQFGVHTCEKAGPMSITLVRQDRRGSLVWLRQKLARDKERLQKLEAWQETQSEEALAKIKGDDGLPEHLRPEPDDAPKDTDVLTSEEAVALPVEWCVPVLRGDMSQGWEINATGYAKWKIHKFVPYDVAGHVAGEVIMEVSLQELDPKLIIGAEGYTGSWKADTRIDQLDIGGHKGELHGVQQNGLSMFHFDRLDKAEPPSQPQRTFDKNPFGYHLIFTGAKHGVELFCNADVRAIGWTEKEWRKGENVTIFDGVPAGEALADKLRDETHSLLKSLRLEHGR